MRAKAPILLLRVRAARGRALLRSPAVVSRLRTVVRARRAHGPSLEGWPEGMAELGRVLRRAGLVVAVELAVREAIARLPELASLGPVLLVVAPIRRPADLDALAELRRTLARTRSATLRVALSRPVPCWLGPFRPDLHVRFAGESEPAWAHGCAICGERERCPGPGSDAAVRARPERVSNQFDLEELDPEAAARVPGPDGVSRCSVVLRGRARHFAVVDDGARSAAIERAIDRGQLYLDVSSKARITDFAAQTRLLRPTGEGGYEPVPGEAFAAAEAALIATLDGLCGLVIDVGAGPLRYVGRMAAAIARDRLRYLAVEPAPAHLASSAAALPGGDFVRAVGEHLPVADGAANAVLMLRSWNHLEEPPAALAEARRVLRPGGMIVIIDNVLFGLCRSPRQLARARAIPTSRTPFEHLRNDDGAAAARAVTAAGFAVVRLDDVGPGRANQWLLTAAKTGP